MRMWIRRIGTVIQLRPKVVIIYVPNTISSCATKFWRPAEIGKVERIAWADRHATLGRSEHVFRVQDWNVYAWSDTKSSRAGTYLG